MKTKGTDETTLILLGEEHSGRDEMNLAGNPFALLQAASRAGQSLIQYEFERQLPNGKIVTAKWEVNGHAQLGLPGPNEELLYLVLLQITRETANGEEWPREVNFSRHDVLKRMQWNDAAATYRTLEDCFTRLTNVTINARHSFWNAKTKMPYEATSFGLIDDFGISAEPPGTKKQGTLALSWFRWNQTLHESFLAGNVRSLALEFVLSLELPTTRRLFRLLDMMKGSSTPPRREFTIGLFKLRARLGMTDYKYASKIKEKLTPAIEELKQRGYLESVRFEKGKSDENAVFRFAIASLPIEALETPKTPPKRQKQAVSSSVQTNKGNIQDEAQKCYEVFKSLSGVEQTELLDQARSKVEPAFWDRVGSVESPMSLGLWQLVVARYPDKIK